MPHKLTWEPQGVYWQYYGHVSGQEIIEASTSIYGDPRFDKMRYKLVNFLDIDSVEMSKKEASEIALQHKAAEASNPNIKNAILVKSRTSELANYFAAFFADSHWEVQVFDDLDEANAWLGRKPS